MSKKILAGQVWRLTKEAQERAQAFHEVLDQNIKFSQNVTVTGFDAIEDKFEAEDLNASTPWVFVADDFERFVSHAPKEDEFDEEDDDAPLSAPGYYDN